MGISLRGQSTIYARSKLDPDCSALAGRARPSSHLKPAADRRAEHRKRSEEPFVDETGAPVLDPGRGRARAG